MALTLGCLGLVALAGLGPRPGEVWREITVGLKTGNRWRVTDPAAEHPGAAAFLPNPVIDVPGVRLAGVTRAELLLDRWGGHPGTSDKRVRFNGHPWLPLPELLTTPADRPPTAYMAQDNPVVPLPLEHLVEGLNRLEGTCGPQTVHSFGWGQWGWYGLHLRLFENRPPSARARIVEPAEGAVLGEGPTIRLAVEPGVRRIDLLARYDGFDEDGDGVWDDWHGYVQKTTLTGHVGTLTGPPWELVWDTRWVPDQTARAMSLLARVQAADGSWWVTEPVDGLLLRRQGESVRLFRPRDVPERFWVRAGRRMHCFVDLPADYDWRRVSEAAVIIRTWNGQNEELRVNDWLERLAGANHDFAQSLRRLPSAALRAGENRLSVYAATEHHGPEILWPGPALLIRSRTE